MIKEKILHSVDECLQALTQLKQPQALLFIEKASFLLAETFRQGSQVILAGNGGSLCDASHFAEELTGVFRRLRPALPALVLSEPGHLSCVGNDLGYEWVFSRGIEAFGKPGDLFIGLTTSGKSPNIIRAFETAKQKQLKTIAFLGKDGGKLRGFADLELLIEGFKTSDRIQEAHMAAIHILIEAMELMLFPEIYSRSSEEEISAVLAYRSSFKS